MIGISPLFLKYTFLPVCSPKNLSLRLQWVANGPQDHCKAGRQEFYVRIRKVLFLGGEIKKPRLLGEQPGCIPGVCDKCPG